MAERMTSSEALTNPLHPLVCRIRKKTTGRAASSPLAGEIELENISSIPIHIDFQMAPVQYFELLIKDSKGNLVSDGHYGDRFSPMENPASIELQPGDKFIAPISLLATLPQDKLQAGCYRVTAVYKYKEIEAVSAPIDVRLDEASANRLQLKSGKESNQPVDPTNTTPPAAAETFSKVC